VGVVLNISKKEKGNNSLSWLLVLKIKGPGSLAAAHNKRKGK